jgi:hypothetical protein
MPNAGDDIEASDILVRCGCRVRRAAVQSINNNSGTALSWDTEDEDTDGFIAVTSTTVTIPTGKGGLYAVTVMLDPAGTMNNRLLMDFKPTSSITGLPAQFRSEPNTDQTIYSASWTIPLAAADTFIVEAFHTDGAAVDFTGWMSCYRVGV